MRMLVVFHLAFTVMELTSALSAESDLLIIAAEAVPKFLGAGAAYLYSRKPILCRLTPSHQLKVLKLKAL